MGRKTQFSLPLADARGSVTQPVSTPLFVSRDCKGAVRLVVCGVLMAVVATVAAAGGPGFRTAHLLEEHYNRFGVQFRAGSIQQYLKLAQQLRDTAPGRGILVSSRPDGGGSKFDVKRGWFVAYDGDGTLRTFFKPKHGVRFFNRQKKSPAPLEE